MSKFNNECDDVLRIIRGETIDVTVKYIREDVEIDPSLLVSGYQILDELTKTSKHEEFNITGNNILVPPTATENLLGSYYFRITVDFAGIVTKKDYKLEVRK